MPFPCFLHLHLQVHFPARTFWLSSFPLSNIPTLIECQFLGQPCANKSQAVCKFGASRLFGKHFVPISAQLGCVPPPPRNSSPRPLILPTLVKQMAIPQIHFRSCELRPSPTKTDASFGRRVPNIASCKPKTNISLLASSSFQQTPTLSIPSRKCTAANVHKHFLDGHPPERPFGLQKTGYRRRQLNRLRNAQFPASTTIQSILSGDHLEAIGQSTAISSLLGREVQFTWKSPKFM